MADASEEKFAMRMRGKVERVIGRIMRGIEFAAFIFGILYGYGYRSVG